MTQRTAPQSRTDERAFPIRIKVRVPQGGFGNLLTGIHGWLDHQVGRGNWASHPAPGMLREEHITAVYLRDTGTAHRLVETFPELVLADGTLSPSYSSVTFPFGRK